MASDLLTFFNGSHPWNLALTTCVVRVHWDNEYENGHPDGGLIGLGISPDKTVRWRNCSRVGSGVGTADNNAFEVYGC